MDLPVRIVDGCPSAPVVAVDGAMGAPGLELSHWPGHRTPAALRHDLSTGCALAYAALDRGERTRLARGATAIVNNHFDTDGCCALFAVRFPAQALARAPRMLAAAAAGDFFAWPDDDALCVDAVVGGLVDAERSPLRGAFAALDASARRQRALEHVLECLPALLDGDLAPYRGLWEPALERARQDRARLATCERDEIAHLAWSVVESRDGRPFDPGRHALFGSTQADRVLALGTSQGGTTARLVLGTRGWFDLVSPAPPPRPDLAELARQLNEWEGSDPGAEAAWRAQDVAGPSPELWFGARDLEMFAEHAQAHLRPSALAPSRIRRAVAEALRTALLPTLGIDAAVGLESRAGL